MEKLYLIEDSLIEYIMDDIVLPQFRSELTEAWLHNKLSNLKSLDEIFGPVQAYQQALAYARFKSAETVSSAPNE